MIRTEATSQSGSVAPVSASGRIPRNATTARMAASIPNARMRDPTLAVVNSSATASGVTMRGCSSCAMVMAFRHSRSCQVVSFSLIRLRRVTAGPRIQAWTSTDTSRATRRCGTASRSSPFGRSVGPVAWTRPSSKSWSSSTSGSPRICRTSGPITAMPRTLLAVGRFFAVTFPAALWHIRWFVAVATLVSVLPAVGIGIWLANSPAAVEATAPAAVREAYVNHDFEAYYSSAPASEFAASVFSNNVQVAFVALALWILLCVGTLYVLIVNGANLGIALGLFAAVGQQPKFWGLVLPHGMLELTSVFIAGAAGLRLGWTLIDPDDRPRLTALAEEGRRTVVIVVGLILTFAAAGAIEGFVTGRPWPTALRVGIGGIVEIAFLAYALTLGRGAAARGLTGALGERDEGGWLVPARDPTPRAT